MNPVADISSNQPHPIDYKAASKALGAVIVKLGQGSTYVSPVASEDVKGFTRRGLPVAGYWFLDPQDYVGPQVERGLAVARDLGIRRMFVDSELAWNGSTNWEMTPVQWGIVAEATKAMLDGFKAHLPTSLYSSPGFLDGLAGWEHWGVDVWLADYGPAHPPFPCALWQFTDAGKVPGIRGPVDLSTYQGVSDVWRYFGLRKPGPVRRVVQLVTGRPMGAADRRVA